MPRYAGAVYPVSLVRADDDTGEPIRGPDGLCQVCEPGTNLFTVMRNLLQLSLT